MKSHTLCASPTFLLVVTLLAGCGTTLTDPQGVGTGRYLQSFARDGRVVAEMDTHMAGLLNCPNQAYLSIQSTPSMAGLTKCSDHSLAGALPFSFVAHRQLTESDGYRRSSPYLTRVITGQLCASIREATSKMEKTVILEDNCRDSSTPTIAPQRESGITGQRPTSPSPAPADSLRQLEQLKRDGLITGEEYNTRRKTILDRL